MKLDEKQFESCMNSGKYAAEIQKDLEEGMKAGVAGTPGFFINGVPLSGAKSAEAFTHVIEQQLTRSSFQPVHTKGILRRPVGFEKQDQAHFWETFKISKLFLVSEESKTLPETA